MQQELSIGSVKFSSLRIILVPFTVQDIQEELSYAYVHAVASRAGFGCDRPNKDRDSSDVTISAYAKLAPESIFNSPKLDIQLKATASELTVNNHNQFPLSISKKNYDDLRRPNHVPKLLVLFIMPSDAAEWLINNQDALIARRCCYWCNLTGLPDVDTESRTVYVPRLNIFSPEALNQLLTIISRGESSAMRSRELSETLLGKVTPLTLKQYARSTGWAMVAEPQNFVIYRVSGNHDVEVAIPEHPEFADYARRVSEAVNAFARYEGRPALEILNDLLVPPADVLRLAVTSPSADNGTLYLLDGFNLLNGARKTLLAAASDVLSPAPYHPRLARSEAEAFVRNCKLGQTERGSFVATLVCPIYIKPTDQGEMFPDFAGDSFTRKVTTHFMRAISRVLRRSRQVIWGNSLIPAQPTW